MLLAAAPLAGASHTRPAIFDAHMDGAFPVAIPALTFGPAPRDECGEERFTFYEEESKFRFSENRLQTGCGELRYNLSVPIGISAFNVLFEASREVREAAEPAEFPILASQELRLYDAQGALLTAVAYVDPRTGTRENASFDIPFTIPDGHATLQLAWFFEDRGFSFGQNLPTSGAHAYAANVSNPTIRLPGLTIQFGQVVNETFTEEDHVRRTVTVLAAQVPVMPFLDLEAVLRLEIAVDSNVTRIVAPNGSELQLGEYQLEHLGTYLLLTIPDALRFGPGTYALAFMTEEVLPPPPPPAAPLRLVGLGLLLLGLPLVPAVFAVHAEVRYHTTARQQGQSVRLLPAILGVLLLAYAAAVLFAFRTDAFGAMETFPLTTLGWAFNGGFTAFGLAFVFFWVLLAGVLVRALRQDIERRAALQRSLERSNRDLEQFASVASHDLQEPLRTIAGFSQILAEQYAPHLDRQGRDYVERTVHGTKRMQRLVQDLLAYARVETRALPPVQIPAGQVVKRVLQDLDELVRSARARVHVGTLPTVRADPVQLGQVFQNLLANAIHYRGKRRPVIHVTAEEKEDNWEFAVRDNGQGIDPRHHERIFQLFERLAPASREGSTGLGLAICKKIIERHGGRIWVESQPGRGTTFRFTFPKVEPHA